MRVLLVDDDPRLLRVLEARLRRRGMDVVTAFGAPAALQMIRAGEAEAVVTDIRMPGTDGVRLAHIIRAAAPEIPVFALSGATACSDRDAFDCIFPKPEGISALVDTLADRAHAPASRAS